MAKAGTILTAVIASPSDVSEERQAIREAITQWNASEGLRLGIVLVPLMWELDVAPVQGDRPQAIVNRQLLEDADILIATFWSRLGTPTGVAESGTAEEIQWMLSEGKQVSVYFCMKGAPPLGTDVAEVARLQQFKNELQQTGIQIPYESTAELIQRLQRDLHRLVDVTLRASVAPQAESAAPTPANDLKPANGDPEQTENRAHSAFRRVFSEDFREGIVDVLALPQSETVETRPELLKMQLLAAVYRTKRYASALKDAEEHAKPYPDDPEILALYGGLLIFEERYFEAIPILQKALNSTLIESNKVQIATDLASGLMQTGRREDAFSLLREFNRTLPPGPDKARILQFTGDLHSLGLEKKQSVSLRLYEAALWYSPGSDDLRFSTAYAYAECGEYDLAAMHYSKLIDRQASLGAVTNNLGIIAANLGLDLVAADFYRNATNSGSDEAIGNLVAVMERVGLRDEATSLISSARREGRSTSYLDKVAGDLARRAESEQEQLSIAVERGRVESVRRIGEGTAMMIQDASSNEFVGDFVSGTYPFHVEVDVNGKLTGWFQRDSNEFATFIGHIAGEVMLFSWVKSYASATSATGRALLTTLAVPHGEGCLRLTDGGMVGSWSEISSSGRPPTQHRNLDLRRVDSSQAKTLAQASAPIATSLLALLNGVEKEP